jgi:hypothetical protein
MFDLTADVVTRSAFRGGLRAEAQMRVQTNLRSTGEHVRSPHWKHQAHKAGADPAAFHDLRAHIPPRRPHGK